MLFNSYIFLLLFLPLTLVLYYGCSHLKKETAAKWILILASFIFYGYFDVRYLPVILASICFNYGCSKGLLSRQYEKYKREILGVGILGNVGLLFYIKYWNFFLENVNAVLGSNFKMTQVLLPLGISFFTFQQIAYLVDSYRGETKEYNFTDYTLFVTFFPKISMGPIVFHQQMMPQLRNAGKNTLNADSLARGIYRFSIGIAKKVLLADTLAQGVDWAYGNVDVLQGADVLVVSLLYTLQIYFDFSGYCDMAMGVGDMFQIAMPKNFNSPYKAGSITEFWNRWHITLSGFLQKYIYFPLGGSRKGFAATIRNILLVFLISGIWHGAAWTFIIWGMLHGVARVLHKIFEKTWEKVPKVVAVAATFGFVNISWIFFRAENPGQAGVMLKKMFSPWQWKLEPGLLQQFDVLEFTYIEEHVPALLNMVTAYPQIHLLLILMIGLLLVFIPKNLYEKEFCPGLLNGFMSVILLVWSILSFSGVSTFLYFNF